MFGMQLGASAKLRRRKPKVLVALEEISEAHSKLSVIVNPRYLVVRWVAKF